MHSFWSRLLVVIAGLSLLVIWSLRTATESFAHGAAALQSGGSLIMNSPSACPSGGCAAGQTLTMLATYPISGHDTSLSPNLKVCVLIPNAWAVDSNTVSMDTAGQTTNIAYSNDATNCQGLGGVPADYTVIVARQAAMTGTWNQDSLRVSFRIPSTTSSSSAVKVRVFTQATGNVWNMISDLTSSVVPLRPAAETSYVANDAAGCGSLGPCYINSGPDGTGGVGTGLKDAVDAIPQGVTNGVVNILGTTYTIKTNAVYVDQPVTITSLSSSPGTITYSGTESDANCSASMLLLRESITVSNLYIKDGNCTTKNRTLIEVDPDPNRDIVINITSNTLSLGRDAIFIHDIKAQVNVQYNDIFGNSGYSLNWSGASKLGGLRAIANNMVAGGTAQVECAGGAAEAQANRLVNHNYWGSTYIPDANTHCVSVASKRLGAPILPRPGKPGVSAARVTVTDKMPTRAPTPTDAPDGQATATLVPIYGQLAFNRSGDGSQDFDMYIVDHGFAIDDNVPFTRPSGRGPDPCGNYYDFFLPDGVNPPNTTLDLYFYYDTGSSDCETMTRYSNVCQARTPTPATVPLMWYNPTAMPTAWASVLQGVGSESGQPVTCNTTQKQLHVAIDASGRPGLNSDMSYTPLMWGAPLLQNFQALAQDKKINVTWTTSAEPDIDEFAIYRGNSATSLSQHGDIFPSDGDSTTGSTYSYLDENLINGQTYYYRLKIKRLDGKYIYSEIRSVAPNVPTKTPLPSATPVTPSVTPSFTLVPSSQPTRAITATPTLGPGTPSPTSFLLPTLTGPAYSPTPLFGLTGTPGLVPSVSPSATFGAQITTTTTPSLTLPAKLGTGTAIAMVSSQTPTPTRRPTRTATPGATAVTGEIENGPTWLSLALGLLAGIAAAVGAGSLWLYYRNRP